MKNSLLPGNNNLATECRNSHTSWFNVSEIFNLFLDQVLNVSLPFMICIKSFPALARVITGSSGFTNQDRLICLLNLDLLSILKASA